jgi:hypothetical protein
MFAVGKNSYSRQWGALEENLKAEHYTDAQIEQAKKELSEGIRGTRNITPKIRELYQKSFPKNCQKKVFTIVKELKKFCVQTVLDILASFPLDYGNKPDNFVISTLESLQQKDSFIENRLDALRRLGESKFTDRYFSTVRSFKSVEERIFREESIAKSIIQEFSEGFPTSCRSMVNMIRSRKFFDLLTHIEPMADSNPSLKILRRLADLGDSIAQKELHSVVKYNRLGNNQYQIELKLLIEERIEILKSLALSGHIDSQDTLALLCYTNSIGNDQINLTEEQRSSAIIQLQQIDNELNKFFQGIIAANRIDMFPLPLSLENRLDVLSLRAKNGDIESYDTLFEACSVNVLNKEHLNLTKELRLAKLYELKELNPERGCAFFVRGYLSNKISYGIKLHDNLKLNLSMSERFLWLEDQAHNCNNDFAQEKMVYVYVKNEFYDCILDPDLNIPILVGKRLEKIPSGYIVILDLKIPLAQRLEKMLDLADKGVLSAQEKLINYWLFPRKSLRDQINRNNDEEYTKPTSEMIFNHMLKWSFLKGGFVNNFFELLINSNKRKTLEYLFNIHHIFQKRDKLSS